MAEYIERSAAVKIAEKYGLTKGSTLGLHSGVADCIESEILTLPAADVAPVVHGKWIKSTRVQGRRFNIPHCSVCESVPCGVDENTKFCPNCGAKMDEEVSE